MTEPLPPPFDAPPADALDGIEFTEQVSFLLFRFGPLVAFKATFHQAEKGCLEVPFCVRVAGLVVAPVAAPVYTTPAAHPPTPAMTPASTTTVSPPAMCFHSPFVELVTPLNSELDRENIDHDFETEESESDIDVFADVASSTSVGASIVFARSLEKDVQLPTETATEVPRVWESHDHLIVINTDFHDDAEHPDPVECLKFDVHHHSDSPGKTDRE